jgi:hypothetical protein
MRRSAYVANSSRRRRVPTDNLRRGILIIGQPLSTGLCIPAGESRIIFTVRCRGGRRCTDDVAKFRRADGTASSVEIGAPSNKAVKLSDFLQRTVSPSRSADEDGRKGFLKELLQAFSNDQMIVHKEGLFLTYSVQTEAASKKPSSMSGRAE